MCYTSKGSLLFFSLLLLPPFFANAETNPPGNTIPPITVSLNPTFNMTVAPDIINNSTAVNNLTHTNINSMTMHMYDMVHNALTNNKQIPLKNLIKQLLWERRYTIVGGATLSLYGAVSLLLLADYHFITKDSLWSNWKSDYSFVHLCEIPQKELEQELLSAIAQRNCNKNNPTDLSVPLMEFIKAIENEIYRMHRYIATASMIKRIKLMTIFPTNDIKIECAKKLHERAHFIKHIFLSWLANYNFATNKK